MIGTINKLILQKQQQLQQRQQMLRRFYRQYHSNDYPRRQAALRASDDCCSHRRRRHCHSCSQQHPSLAMANVATNAKFNGMMQKRFCWPEPFPSSLACPAGAARRAAAMTSRSFAKYSADGGAKSDVTAVAVNAAAAAATSCAASNSPADSCEARGKAGTMATAIARGIDKSLIVEQQQQQKLDVASLIELQQSHRTILRTFETCQQLVHQTLPRSNVNDYGNNSTGATTTAAAATNHANAARKEIMQIADGLLAVTSSLPFERSLHVIRRWMDDIRQENNAGTILETGGRNMATKYTNSYANYHNERNGNNVESTDNKSKPSLLWTDPNSIREANAAMQGLHYAFLTVVEQCLPPLPAPLSFSSSSFSSSSSTQSATPTPSSPTSPPGDDAKKYSAMTVGRALHLSKRAEQLGMPLHRPLFRRLAMGIVLTSSPPPPTTPPLSTNSFTRESSLYKNTTSFSHTSNPPLMLSSSSLSLSSIRTTDPVTSSTTEKLLLPGQFQQTKEGMYITPLAMELLDVYTQAAHTLLSFALTSSSTSASMVQSEKQELIQYLLHEPMLHLIQRHRIEDILSLYKQIKYKFGIDCFLQDEELTVNAIEIVKQWLDNEHEDHNNHDNDDDDDHHHHHDTSNSTTASISTKPPKGWKEDAHITELINVLQVSLSQIVAEKKRYQKDVVQFLSDAAFLFPPFASLSHDYDFDSDGEVELESDDDDSDYDDSDEDDSDDDDDDDDDDEADLRDNNLDDKGASGDDAAHRH